MTTVHLLAFLLAALAAIGAVLIVRRCVGVEGDRFFRHPGAALALAWLVFLAVAALAAPLLAPYRASRQLDIVVLANQSPSWLHPFGTDFLSRDVLSRLLFGARISLGIGALAMVLALTIGAVIGMAAGYLRGATDAVLMRLVDVGLAVPRIFVVLVVIALSERLGVGTLILLLGLTGWFGTCRLARAEVLALRASPFVDAATAIGATRSRVIVRHILPNVAAPLIVSAALGVGNVILLEAALSFLGAGVQPPDPSWGNMIADGRDQLATAPWTTLFPGLAIALAVMALNAVGDGLRDALDPRREAA